MVQVKLVGVRPDMAVIDVAAGTGALALQAARVAKDVLAVDFSEGMLSVLEERARAEGIRNVETAVMDGQDLELDDATFDAAFSVFGLMMFPDRAAGFSELARVVRPGGRAAVVVWDDPEALEFMGTLQQAVMQAVPDFSPPDTVPPWLALTDPVQLTTEMAAGGFEAVNVYSLCRLWQIESLEDFAVRLDGIAPGCRFLFENLDEDEVAAVREAFVSVLRARFGEGPYALRGPAHIAIGRR